MACFCRDLQPITKENSWHLTNWQSIVASIWVTFISSARFVWAKAVTTDARAWRQLHGGSWEDHSRQPASIVTVVLCAPFEGETGNGSTDHLLRVELWDCTVTRQSLLLQNSTTRQHPLSHLVWPEPAVGLCGSWNRDSRTGCDDSAQYKHPTPLHHFLLQLQNHCCGYFSSKNMKTIFLSIIHSPTCFAMHHILTCFSLKFAVLESDWRRCCSWC